MSGKPDLRGGGRKPRSRTRNDRTIDYDPLGPKALPRSRTVPGKVIELRRDGSTVQERVNVNRKPLVPAREPRRLDDWYTDGRLQTAVNWSDWREVIMAKAREAGVEAPHHASVNLQGEAARLTNALALFLGVTPSQLVRRLLFAHLRRSAIALEASELAQVMHVDEADLAQHVHQWCPHPGCDGAHLL